MRITGKVKAPVFPAAFLFLSLSSVVPEKLFLPMKAAAFGLSGDRTENMLWRMEDTDLAVNTPPR